MGLSFLRDQNVEKRREEEKREEEEEQEKKKRREEEREIKKVWKLTLSMDSSMDHMDFVWITWISCIDTCLWVVGCRKPNPRMSSCMEIITNPFVFLGFCYEKT